MSTLASTMSTTTNNGLPTPTAGLAPVADDPHGTRLIARLANEIYSDDRTRIPASKAPAPGLPARLDAIPPVHPKHQTDDNTRFFEEAPRSTSYGGGNAGGPS